MKNLIHLLAVLFFLPYSNAQNISLEFNGKINYLQTDQRITRTESQGAITTVMDSFRIRSEALVRTTREKTYDPGIGYEVNGTLKIQLSGRVALTAGLGLNYLSWTINDEVLDRQMTILSTDTIFEPASTFTFSPSCDLFENSFSDVGPIDRGYQQHLVNLMIPVGLRYDIWPDKLMAGGGAILQTPLFAMLKREFVTIHRETNNGVTACRYVKINEKNTSGNGINNLQVAVYADLQYQVLKKVAVQLGVRKSLNNIFNGPNYQTYPQSSEKLKPWVFSAGLTYQVGNWELFKEKKNN